MKGKLNSFNDPGGWRAYRMGRNASFDEKYLQSNEVKSINLLIANARSLLSGYINYLSKAKAIQNQVKETPEPYSNDILTENY